MLTPDSSRFRPLEGFKVGAGQPSYDKQYVRDWLKANPDSDYLLPEDVIEKTIEKYKEAFKLLTGEDFKRQYYNLKDIVILIEDITIVYNDMIVKTLDNLC